MNSQQIKSGDVPIPTYSYYNKINSELTDQQTWKSNFDNALKVTCADLDKGKASVSAPDLSTLSAYQQKAYQEFTEKNPNPADLVTANVVAGINPTISGNKDNQIKYLACQVAKMHARQYDSSQFQGFSRFGSIKEVFSKFATMKPYVAIVFFISVYLYVQGVFGSMDIGYNVATNLFKGESSNDIGYWTGLLFGVSLPFIIIMIMFQTAICSSLEKQDHWDITKNPFGDKTTLSNDQKKLDYWMVALFILFIYGFIGVLYTIGAMDKKMNWLILSIVIGILVIITVFIYIFYSYTPFIASATDQTSEASQKQRTLQVYVEKLMDIDIVKTNTTQDKTIKRMFLGTMIMIYVLAMLFFTVANKVGGGTGFGKSLIRGATGAGAILVIPILWVFNTVLAFNYFYLYPIFIFMARGLRFVGQLVASKMKNKLNSATNNFQRGLEGEGLSEYSPSWGLLGVSLLKSWMNICGFENKFSKDIVEEGSYQKNISQNSWVSGFFLLKMLVDKEKSKTGWIVTGAVLAITILITVIMLFGVEKIQDIDGDKLEQTVEVDSTTAIPSKTESTDSTDSS